MSCPSTNAPLPVKAFPSLLLGTAGPIRSGDTILLLTPGFQLWPEDSKGSIYAAFITIAGPIFAVPTVAAGEGYKVTVPQGVNGQTYVVLTGCSEYVNDETIAAGPAIVEVTNL